MSLVQRAWAAALAICFLRSPQSAPRRAIPPFALPPTSWRPSENLPLRRKNFSVALKPSSADPHCCPIASERGPLSPGPKTSQAGRGVYAPPLLLALDAARCAPNSSRVARTFPTSAQGIHLGSVQVERLCPMTLKPIIRVAG